MQVGRLSFFWNGLIKFAFTHTCATPAPLAG
jgi:hypothetical protein